MRAPLGHDCSGRKNKASERATFIRPLAGVKQKDEVLAYLENVDGAASFSAFLPKGYTGTQLTPICCPGMDHANRDARCLAAATRKLREAGADLRFWDADNGHPLDASSISRLPVRAPTWYRVWLDMTTRLDKPNTRKLIRATLAHVGPRLRVFDINASLVYVPTDAYQRHFDALDEDVRRGARRAGLVVSAHTPPFKYRSTGSNMMRAAYTFTPASWWLRLQRFFADRLGIAETVSKPCERVPDLEPKSAKTTTMPTIGPKPQLLLLQPRAKTSVGATVTKCFLAPGYFCNLKALDEIVPPGKAKRTKMVLRGEAVGKSWPVVYLQGKGLSGGWRRAAIELGLAVGDCVKFTYERGSLIITK